VPRGAPAARLSQGSDRGIDRTGPDQPAGDRRRLFVSTAGARAAGRDGAKRGGTDDVVRSGRLLIGSVRDDRL